VGLSTLGKWIRAISEEARVPERDADLLRETERLRKENQCVLTFEDFQTDCWLIQGCQMGGNLDPHDIDRHAVGADRPALPGPGM
jgi:hypothetical protein